MRQLIFSIISLSSILSLAQNDTIKVGLSSYYIGDTIQKTNYDSLFNVQGNFIYSSDYYKNRYTETDLMYKVTDNKGNGFDSLYGTRNMRPILHGVAYRGGANNYYHLTDKRHNHNPIPIDGMSNLCQEGFSKGIYLYRENFENSPIGDTCSCTNDSWNNFEYYQKDYFDDQHIKDMLEMTYNSATMDSVGPIYLHCWNGWHASGYISAVILKQFCGYSSWDAVNYWDLGTDGANTSPRYQHQRERIKDFEPHPEFNISDSLQNCLCPPMPTNVDSSQLHIEIEHLVIVPEAIPVGFQIVLYNIKFGSGKSTFSNVSKNIDIINLKKALTADTNLKIELGGYTDNSGSTSKNIAISKKRAQFVYDHLIKSGFSKDRISFAGYGPAKPIFSNRYKSTRAGNRRIEVKIIQKTVHTGTTLVDETIEHSKIITAKKTNEHKKYLSYFISNPTEKLQSNFIIDSLQFLSGSFSLDSTGSDLKYLNELVQYLQNNKYIKAHIHGYTDASGIPEKNAILSEERAKVIYNYLILHKINQNRLHYSGHGSENPIATNTYKWGRDLNRRIEVEFMKD